MRFYSLALPTFHSGLMALRLQLQEIIINSCLWTKLFPFAAFYLNRWQKPLDIIYFPGREAPLVPKSNFWIPLTVDSVTAAVLLPLVLSMYLSIYSSILLSVGLLLCSGIRHLFPNDLLCSVGGWIFHISSSSSSSVCCHLWSGMAARESRGGHGIPVCVYTYRLANVPMFIV